MTGAWPAMMAEGAVRLRPLRRRDRRAWNRTRLANAAWLDPWEATSPDPVGQPPSPFSAFVTDMQREARAGRSMPFAIDYEGRLVGQLTVTGIAYGSLCSASIGYWVAREVAGRGIAPTAVALAADHAWFRAGLHRIEVAIRPENRPSLRVVEKLGFRDEGMRPRYLHIAGEWRDHRIFALNVEEVPGGLTHRWRLARAAG
jgi:ribosomal-protein-alanine N-acetyltransferase